MTASHYSTDETMSESDKYLAFIREVGSADAYTVKLVTAVDTKDPEKDFYHAYVLLKTEHVPYLKAALRTRVVDLDEYGVVLARGKGINPLPETQASVKAQFEKYAHW